MAFGKDAHKSGMRRPWRRFSRVLVEFDFKPDSKVFCKVIIGSDDERYALLIDSILFNTCDEISG